MLIELKGHVDGAEVTVRWHDGLVEGGPEALRRITQVSAATPLDRDQLDPVSILRCADNALGGRLACAIVETAVTARQSVPRSASLRG